jgi:hypothetical protein
MKAQALKTKDDDSLLHNILHILANFIVDELEDTIEFDEKIKTLEEKYQQKEEEIKKCNNTASGKNIETLRNESRSIIFELAAFKRIDYVYQAVERNLFNHLTLLSEEDAKFLIAYNRGAKYKIHSTLPLQMQKEYPGKLYKETFQAFKENCYKEEYNIEKTIDFVQFIADCSNQHVESLITTIGTKRVETEKEKEKEEKTTQQKENTSLNTSQDKHDNTAAASQTGFFNNLLNGNKSGKTANDAKIEQPAGQNKNGKKGPK